MMRRLLSDRLPVGHPRDYLIEVLRLVHLDQRSPPGVVIAAAYRLAIGLYQGKCPGYRACDTGYHDFVHAAETFLTMARLLHGACLASAKLSPREIAVGLTAAILHDAGYIPKAGESAVNGAVFHSEHEVRSMAFVSQHAEVIGLRRQEVEDCHAMIQGTRLAQDVNAMAFRSDPQELMVRMLSAADLLAQLSSANYLERLRFLYDEDRAARRNRYAELLECYRQALCFDERANARILRHLDQMDAYLIRHFTARWNMPANLYRLAMDRQIEFLEKAIAVKNFDPHSHLRRWGSLSRLQRILGVAPENAVS